MKKTKLNVKRKVAAPKRRRVNTATQRVYVKPAAENEPWPECEAVEPVLIRVPSVCRCGCGKPIVVTGGHRKRRFFDGACRVRFLRARKAAAGLIKRRPWAAAARRKEVAS